MWVSGFVGGVGFCGFAEYYLRKTRKPPLEVRGDLNRFDFLGPVPRGNSIVEIRTARAIGQGNSRRTLLRLDAHTFAMIEVTLGKIPIPGGLGALEVLVDGRLQTPPPGRD